MKVVLDEYFSKYTNGFSEHEVEAVTASEAMAVVCNRYPQLLVHLQWDNAKICETSGLRLDGEYLEGHDKVHETPVEPESVLELLRLPPVPEGEKFFTRAFMYIAAAVMIVVGVILQFVPGGQMFGTMLITIGVNLLIQAAFFYPSMPSLNLGEIEGSSAYTFDGVTNTTASGIPVPLVYGTHRIGGQVLNMYTETDNEPVLTTQEDGKEIKHQHTFLLAQLALCEGEIESASEVFINDLPATFYNAVETVGFTGGENFIRKGTKNQTPMPAFTETRNSVAINRKVAVMQSEVKLPKPQFTDLEPVYGYVTVDNRGRAEVVQKRVKYELTYEYDDYGNWG